MKRESLARDECTLLYMHMTIIVHRHTQHTARTDHISFHITTSYNACKRAYMYRMSAQVATRNNMAVWRDTCLKGSLRVVRPGELERKIVDLVTDDQDSEPENVVHTHLCILLAEGDDLELNRPRMSNGSATFASSSSQGLKQYGSGRGIEADGNVDGSGSAAANLSAALEQKSKELEVRDWSMCSYVREHDE